MNNFSDISKKTIQDWLDNEALPNHESEVTEDALIRFAFAHAIEPSETLRTKIIDKVRSLAFSTRSMQKIDLNNPPLLDATSNWMEWEEAIINIKPPATYDSVHLHPLEASVKRELFVAWVKEYVPEEVHYDLVESFLLLEGSCECRVTDTNGHTRKVRMIAGDFISMPAGESHDIIITSLTPVKGILQWLKISA